MNKFQRAREKYKPSSIKVLFVAEAPPKSDYERFFYFEQVSSYDSLFWELMRFIYPDETAGKDIRKLRPDKKKFLDKFMADGYYLEDSVSSPFEEKLTPKQKVKIIISKQRFLLRKLNKLFPDKSTPIVLIANPVYTANYQYLIDNGFNVINKNSITFPLGNFQETFRKEISTIILPHE